MCCEGNANIIIKIKINSNKDIAPKKNVKKSPTHPFTWKGKVDLNSLGMVDNV
jgi:hypothetical protein